MEGVEKAWSALFPIRNTMIENTLDLNPFLQPRTIAILGASKNIAKPNGIPLFMLLETGFPGKLYPVNPGYDEIAGLKCYPDIQSIPDHIDLAIIGVAAGQAIPVLEQCAQQGVKGAVVFTSGFAEAGEQGTSLQQEISRLSRAGGMRIVGPNCVGIINRDNKLWASFAPPLLFNKLFFKKNFHFISQSGFFGILTYQMAAREGLFFDQFFSVGNEADLGLPHFLNNMAEDTNSNTDIIACYIEGIKDKDGEVFKSAAEKALQSNKIISVIKVGQTDAGTRAASSHTAALTGADRVYDAFFEQKGIIRVPGVEQLIPVLKILGAGKYPTGSRTAVISDSGGGAVMLADKCQLYGLDMVRFQPETERQLKEILPFFAATGNPVDLTAQILTEPDLLYKSISIVENDPNVDNLVLNFGIGPNNAHAITNSLKEIYSNSSKTMIAVCWAWSDDESAMTYVDQIREFGLPVFQELDDCVWALGALVRRMVKARKYERPRLYVPGKERDQAALKVKEYFSVASKQTRNSSFAGFSEEKPMSEHTMKQVLSLYNIPVTKEVLVQSKEKAVQAAQDLGGTLALKVVSPDIAHKTEIGGVKLNLGSAGEVKTAYLEIMKNVDSLEKKPELEGILVQQMLSPATEVIIGIKRDPVFGPVVLCGLGGIFVEVLEDVAMRVAPLSRQDAEQMLRELKGYKILQGVRGREPADINAVIDILLKVSRLAVEMENLTEMDINPLMVYPQGQEGQGAVAADAWGMWQLDNVVKI